MSLGKPIQLISQRGQHLTILTETHIYSRSDFSKGIDTVREQEVVGFEGNIFGEPELNTLTDLTLRFREFVLTLFWRESHSFNYPTLHDAAICAGVLQNVDVPHDPKRVNQEICGDLFDSEIPALPSLKKVTYLEPEGLPPSALFPPLCFEGILLGGIFFAGMAFLSLPFKSRRTRFLSLGKGVMELTYRTLNPFTWPRLLAKWRGASFSSRMERMMEWSEVGIFGTIFCYPLVLGRDERMALATHSMVMKNQARMNMIVVGHAHHGIADILVERYGYRRTILPATATQ